MGANDVHVSFAESNTAEEGGRVRTGTWTQLCQLPHVDPPAPALNLADNGTGDHIVEMFPCSHDGSDSGCVESRFGNGESVGSTQPAQSAGLCNSLNAPRVDMNFNANRSSELFSDASHTNPCPPSPSFFKRVYRS